MKPNATAPDNERINQLLAELDEGSAESANSAVRELHAELARLSDELRQAPEPDLHEKESACRRVAEMVAALGRDPSHETIAAAKGALPALGEIGPYKLLAKLGQGGMGTVYKALHTRLEKVVALKVLPADRLRDPDAVARFEREMKAVGKLDHPHIVRALDAGDADGRHFLVMEYVEGIDLGALIKHNGPLGVADACELIRQAALGLQAAHSRGMVHRDIKPRNVMLAAQEFGPPVVKVLDLGLARLSVSRASEANDLTETGHIMGTVDYMAPEQAGDAHSVDIRADVYSLGATLYTLLTGGSVFEGRPYKTFMQKLSALATEPIPPIRERREGIPDELATIVHRMLATDPVERFASPAEVADTLEPFAAGTDLAALLAAVPIEFTESVATGPAVTRTRPASGSPDRAAEDDSRDETVPHQTALQETLPEELAPKVIVGSLRQRRDSTPWFRRSVAVVAVGLAGILVLAAILLSLRTPYGEVVVELPEDVPAEWAKQLKIEVRGDGDVQVVDAASGWSIDVKKGKYAVQLAGGDDRFAIEEDSVTVTRGKKTFVRVTLVPPPSPSSRAAGGEGIAAVWKPTSEQQAFFDAVAKLSPEDQIEKVREKLVEVNPQFDGKAKYKIESGAVVEFSFVSDEVTDIWPVRAFSELQTLQCAASSYHEAKLADLSPLTGLHLTTLACFSTRVSDLSPLSGMPLKSLYIGSTQVSDLSPLTGMELQVLHCEQTRITDLSPLEHMPLSDLRFYRTNVSDLSPLTGMPLTMLHCSETQVSDLSPLKGMPLTYLMFWATPVSDLSPLEGMPLTELGCQETRVSDLSSLIGLPLQSIFCDLRLFHARDDEILRALPLRNLNSSNWSTSVDEYWKQIAARRQAARAFASDVKQLPPQQQADAIREKLHQLSDEFDGTLAYVTESGVVTGATLNCKNKRLDLAALMGFPGLKQLTLIDARDWLDLSPLKFLPLEELNCPEPLARKNEPILREIATLKTINGSPAEEFWKE